MTQVIKLKPLGSQSHDRVGQPREKLAEETGYWFMDPADTSGQYEIGGNSNKRKLAAIAIVAIMGVGFMADRFTGSRVNARIGTAGIAFENTLKSTADHIDYVLTGPEFSGIQQYTIEPGDTLLGIALEHVDIQDGINPSRVVDKIEAMNENRLDPMVLDVGDEIDIPNKVVKHLDNEVD